MARNGRRPELTKGAKEGTEVTTRRIDERKRKELELLEKATDLAIELYGPALKELEKH